MAEVVECSRNGDPDKIIWASDEKSVVFESTVYSEGWKDVWNKVSGGVKKAAAALGDLFKNNPVTKYFKDKAEEWRKNNYITKDDELTGLGYKIAVGEVKPEENKNPQLFDEDGMKQIFEKQD